jgi:hypothetical protein
MSVGRSAGPGDDAGRAGARPAGARLFVAESGADEIAVLRLPSPQTRPSLDWTMVGRIPTADDPQVVAPSAARADARRSSCTSPPGASASAPTRPARTRPIASTPSSGPSTRSPRPQTSSVPHERDDVPRRAWSTAGRASCALPSNAKVVAAHPGGLAPDPPAGRAEGPRRDAAARRRPDQARLLRGAREPQLRPAARRSRPRQRRPAAHGLRRERDAQPARPGHALPAPRPRVRQLRGLDPGALLDRRGQRPRLRRPQLGPGIRRRAGGPTTSASTP